MKLHDAMSRRFRPRLSGESGAAIVGSAVALLLAVAALGTISAVVPNDIRAALVNVLHLLPTGGGAAPPEQASVMPKPAFDPPEPTSELIHDARFGGPARAVAAKIAEWWQRWRRYRADRRFERRFRREERRLLDEQRQVQLHDEAARLRFEQIRRDLIRDTERNIEELERAGLHEAAEVLRTMLARLRAQP